MEQERVEVRISARALLGPRPAEHGKHLPALRDRELNALPIPIDGNGGRSSLDDVLRQADPVLAEDVCQPGRDAARAVVAALPRAESNGPVKANLGFPLEDGDIQRPAKFTRLPQRPDGEKRPGRSSAHDHHRRPIRQRRMLCRSSAHDGGVANAATTPGFVRRGGAIGAAADAFFGAGRGRTRQRARRPCEQGQNQEAKQISIPPTAASVARACHLHTRSRNATLRKLAKINCTFSSCASDMLAVYWQRG